MHLCFQIGSLILVLSFHQGATLEVKQVWNAPLPPVACSVRQGCHCCSTMFSMQHLKKIINMVCNFASIFNKFQKLFLFCKNIFNLQCCCFMQLQKYSNFYDALMLPFLFFQNSLVCSPKMSPILNAVVSSNF